MLEMITWSQLNIHSKPILLLNTKGYYDLFVKWIDSCVQGKTVVLWQTEEDSRPPQRNSSATTRETSLFFATRSTSCWKRSRSTRRLPVAMAWTGSTADAMRHNLFKQIHFDKRLQLFDSFFRATHLYFYKLISLAFFSHTVEQPLTNGRHAEFLGGAKVHANVIEEDGFLGLNTNHLAGMQEKVGIGFSAPKS